MISTAAQLPGENALVLLPRCQMREQGLAIPTDLSFEEWEAALSHAEWIERASPWWVVDLLAFGRAKFHEDYSQALPDADEDVDGFHQSKLRQAEWMADRWPAGTRVTGQSYSAHRAVAKLDRRDAVALLQETDKDGRRLTVRALARRADGIEQALLGTAVTVDGTPVDSPALAWSPEVTDLVPEARAALEARAPRGQARFAFIQGAIWALIWNEAHDAFIEWKA